MTRKAILTVVLILLSLPLQAVPHGSWSAEGVVATCDPAAFTVLFHATGTVEPVSVVSLEVGTPVVRPRLWLMGDGYVKICQSLRENPRGFYAWANGYIDGYHIRGVQTAGNVAIDFNFTER